MNKKYYLLSDWRRNVLLAAAAASLGLTVPACSSDPGNSGFGEDAADQEWSSGNGESYSQGVITEMTETQPGQWKITAEQPAGKEEVAAILHHYDGKTDTLQGAALQRQMQDYSRQYPENRVGGGTGMMDVLMWSSIGYMAGRFLTPNPGYYASPGIMQRNSAWRQNVNQERQQGRGFFGRGFAGTRRAGTAGIRPSTSVSRSAVRGNAPRFGRSSGFGSRGGGMRGFGG